MDVRLSTLSDWAIQSLCETFFVPRLSSLGDIPAFPLPSVAEILLGDPSSSALSSVCLPSPIANRIIDGLARRGKLTANVLDILLDRNRFRLTALLLYCIDIDPEAVVEKIAKSIDVTSIDISFSPCWADLSTPFLKIVKGNCKESLTSFGARHVVGEIGLLELPHFSNLRHLDIGFTSVSREDLRTFVSSLPLLAHLCISGIPVSLFEVFSMADCLTCVGLKHLGLNSLKFVSVKESDVTAVLPEFTAALSSKISAFFSKLCCLESLDLSYVYWDSDIGSEQARVKHALYTILTHSPSITHLDSSGTLSLACVCDVLIATNRSAQLKFLEDFIASEYGYKTAEELGVENCRIAAGRNVNDYRSKHALRNYESFSDAVTKSDFIMWCRDEVIPAQLSSMIYAGLLRMKSGRDFDFKVQKVVTKFFNDLLLRQIFKAKYDEPLVLSHHSRTLLELAFQLFLYPRSFPRFQNCSEYSLFDSEKSFRRGLLLNFLYLSPFICSHPLLLHLAVAAISSLPDDDYSKINFLGKLFEELPATSRQHLAIEKSCLPTLCVKLSDLVNFYDDIERMRLKPKSLRLPMFVPKSYTTVRALSSLCYGLPNLYHFFVNVPDALDNLAEVALRSSYYYIHRDSSADNLYWVAIEYLSYIAEIPLLAHAVCSRKVIKAIVEAASSSPTERMRFASLYLAGLLIVNDELDSIWPDDVEAKDALVAKLFESSDNIEGFRERTTTKRCYLYTTLIPLVKVCNCSEFPAVSAFGLNHLAYFCSSFNAKKYYAETGLCPLCLMRKEVGADVVFGLSIPAELEEKFHAVMKACPLHKEE